MFKNLFGSKSKKNKVVSGEVKIGMYVGTFLIGEKEVYGCYMRNTANKIYRTFITEEGFARIERGVSFKQLTRGTVTPSLNEQIYDYENSNCQLFVSI